MPFLLVDIFKLADLSKASTMSRKEHRAVSVTSKLLSVSFSLRICKPGLID